MKHYHWSSLVVLLLTAVSCLAGGPGCCLNRCGPPGYAYGGDCGTDRCGGLACGDGGACAAATCGGGWRGPEFFVDEYGRPCYGPVVGLMSLFRDALMSCGCGPIYVDEWISDPPECHDPCGEQLPTPACRDCQSPGACQGGGDCGCAFHQYPERNYGWTSGSLASRPRAQVDGRTAAVRRAAPGKPSAESNRRYATRSSAASGRSPHRPAAHVIPSDHERGRQATPPRHRTSQSGPAWDRAPQPPAELYETRTGGPEADAPLVLRPADDEDAGRAPPPRRFTPPKKPSPVRSAGWWH